jgi:hypothetical protein
MVAVRVGVAVPATTGVRVKVAVLVGRGVGPVAVGGCGMGVRVGRTPLS